jgi:hypothetical protein
LRGLVGLVAYEVVATVLLYLALPMSWQHLGWLLALFDLWLPLAVGTAVGLLYIYEYTHDALTLTPRQRAVKKCYRSGGPVYEHRPGTVPGCTCPPLLTAPVKQPEISAPSLSSPGVAAPPEPAVQCIHGHVYDLCDDCRGFWDPEGRRL